VLFGEGVDCFAHGFIESHPYASAYACGIAHTEHGEAVSLATDLEKDMLAQELVLAHKFPDIEMLLGPLAPMAGRTANPLVLDLAFVNFNNPEDLGKDQGHCVQDQWLL
jgi:hypothetical protein